MTLSEIQSPDSIMKAVREFDQLGREKFLRKYGFGKARDYYLELDGKPYDSKAIVGAAHGYEFPEKGPLKWSDFSGGEDTVQAKLEALGFHVRPLGAPRVNPGQILNNDEVAKVFKCSKYGGMRRSRRTNSLVLISNHIESIYEDRWDKDIFFYTGMGQKGDQSLGFGQNKTLAESGEIGIDVRLFEVFERNRYQYQGRVRLAGEPFREKQLDAVDNSRTVWVFPLKLENPSRTPITPKQELDKKQEVREKQAGKLGTDELLKRARHGARKPGKRQAVADQYDRSAYVAELAMRRAKGNCALCHEPAPFKRKGGEPYLEEHHIHWLSRGGEDTIENAVALCPNCHRKMHILDREVDKATLREVAKEIPGH